MNQQLEPERNSAAFVVRSLADRTPASSWAPTRRHSSRLWHEKRGEIEPEDLSGNLIVQLGIGD